MLCDTHKLIAASIYKLVEAELNIKLDYESFLHGSIAPDIHPLMVLMPHVSTYSGKYLYRKIEWLSEKNLKCSRKDFARFSYRLGIVVHFLSDYFCRVHNGVNFINFVSHNKYENELMHFFERNINGFNYRGIVSGIDWRNSIDGIRTFLPEKILEYKKAGKTPDEDMKYSIEVSANVVMKIVLRWNENTFDTIRRAA